MIKKAGILGAAGYFAANSGATPPATLEWNPQELGTSVVRALYNPVGDNSSVVESSGSVSSVSDLSGNGYDLPATNSPNWNSATSTVELDHTLNQHMRVDIDTAPSTNVGHLFVYAELGAADDFGRYIGRFGENDTNESDYAAPFVRSDVGNLLVQGGGSTILDGGTVPTGFNLLEARMEAGNTTYFLNGAQLATVATGSNLNFENLSIGRGWSNSYGASINFRCVCLVEGILTEDNRQRIEGWMMQQCSDQASLPVNHPYRSTVFSDPSSGSDPLAFFDIWRPFDAGNQSDFTTSSAASKTWFDSAPNLITANAGSGNGEEIFSNDTSGHASSSGWEVVSNGIQVLSNEVAIKMRMYDGSVEDGLNHSSSEDFVMMFVETHEGGMSNNRRKKFNGPSSKLQTNNPKNWKHTDDFSTSPSSYVEAAEDSVELPYGFDPTNGTYMLFACMRDITNQRYYQWVIELLVGNSSASNMTVNDSITQSTADGQTVYLISGSTRSDGDDETEYYFQQDTILHKIGYKKMTPDSDNFSTVDTFVRAYADELIAALS